MRKKIGETSESKDGNFMIFTPFGFFDKKDIEYINLKFAKILCKFGFDGWVAPSRRIKQSVHGVIGWYPTEVLLCNPLKSLNYSYRDVSDKTCS